MTITKLIQLIITPPGHEAPDCAKQNFSLVGFLTGKDKGWTVQRNTETNLPEDITYVPQTTFDQPGAVEERQNTNNQYKIITGVAVAVCYLTIQGVGYILKKSL